MTAGPREVDSCWLVSAMWEVSECSWDVLKCEAMELCVFYQWFGVSFGANDIVVYAGVDSQFSIPRVMVAVEVAGHYGVFVGFVG